MKNIAAIILLSFLSYGITLAQTIHKHDLQHFVGGFTLLVDSLGDTIRDSNGSALPDLSHFQVWVGNSWQYENGKRLGKLISEHSGRDIFWWFALDTAGQDGYIHHRVAKYNRSAWHDAQRIYFMYDYTDGRRNGCLTWWEEVDADSIRFRCGQIGHGFSKVKKVVVFPDESFLVHLKMGLGDMGYFWYKFIFLRGDTCCNFIPFYEEEYEWEEGMTEGKRLEILTNYLENPDYRINVITSYISYYLLDSIEVSLPYLRIDSADIKVIDLWELAKEKFGIDTTDMELHYLLPWKPAEPEKDIIDLIRENKKGRQGN